MAGRYWLGVDVGTTFTAAAIHREDGRTEVVQLGSRGAAIPSVLLLREDGELLTGDTARRRAVAEPSRVASGFKRRVGDPVPILIGGSPFAAEALVAKLLRWVVDLVAEREGGPPQGIAVTHPANWGPYKLDLLNNAVRTAGVSQFTLLSEPEAAARHYAEHGNVPDGAVVAVYDLGGGTFDACVLRRDAAGGFELLGQPEGIERLGGLDLDEAVFGHVQRSLPDLFAGLDGEDPSVRAALMRVRDDCNEAKEQLSADVDATIPVLVPGREGREVRLTRSEFEDLIRPSLADTIGCVERSLASAGVAPAALHAVLLVGGSSRVPLVGQLVSAGLGRPVAVDADPKLTVAQGAALAAHAAFPATAEVVPPVVPAPVPVPPEEPPPAPPPFPVVPLPEPDPAGSDRPPRWFLPVALVVFVALVAGVAFALFGNDDDPDGTASDDTTTTTTEPEDDGSGDEDTTTTTTEESESFVHLTSAEVVEGEEVGDVILLSFETNFEMSGPDNLEGPNRHVHLFWDVDPAATSGDTRSQAGTNGTPEACFCWLAYGGASPVQDESVFTLGLRPEGATAICALIATPGDDPDGGHRIADVDGDGEPDLNTGDCIAVDGLQSVGDVVTN